MECFDIIEYLSSLTGFTFDKSVLKRIAMERGVSKVTSLKELDEKTKDLLYADLLYTIYLSPNSSSAISQQHGNYHQSIGSQTINSKKGIYNVMYSLYRKWNDPKLDAISSSEGGMFWSE